MAGITPCREPPRGPRGRIAIDVPTETRVTTRWKQLGVVLARAHAVPAACQLQQAAVVRSRLAQLALIVAVLCVAWIGVDLAGLDAATAARAAPVRVALAAALLAISKLRERPSMQAAMAGFIGLQTLGFGLLQYLLAPGEAGLSLGYGLFPFVIAAQLAIFPLTWGRSLLLGLAPAALLCGPLLAGTRPLDHAFANDAWLFVLILGLAAWGGHMQVRLLVDLLGAQRDASTDGLTGLANRRLAEDRLQSERARAIRRREPLTVAMVDLDHFKHVNDTWGHAVGDLTLVMVAGALQEQVRAIDLAARFGGEEFLVILPGTEPEQAVAVMERIREHIRDLAIPAPGDTLRVTASVGLACLRPSETVGELLARADAALYRAKALGRDRCEVACPEPDDAPCASPA